MNKIFCPLRKTWLKDLPEEKVRVNLLTQMTQDLGYPIEMISLERSLSHLPQLTTSLQSPPKRRVDILVFAKNIHPQHSLYPLLLIECKAIPLNDKAVRQVIGYNQFIGSYFIGLTNQTHSIVGYYDQRHKDYLFQPQLLSYKTLVNQLTTIL